MTCLPCSQNVSACHEQARLSGVPCPSNLLLGSLEPKNSIPAEGLETSHFPFRREVPCVLVGHKVTEVQESLEASFLAALGFLTEEAEEDATHELKETQMFLNAMNAMSQNVHPCRESLVI